MTGELGQQGKKIIDKKYGPEVINTIVGKKEEGHPAGSEPEVKVEETVC